MIEVRQKRDKYGLGETITLTVYSWEKTWLFEEMKALYGNMSPETIYFMFQHDYS